MLDSIVVRLPSEDSAVDAGGDPGRAMPVRRSVLSLVAVIVCIGLMFFGLGQFAGALQREQNAPVARVVVAERFDLIGANGKQAASLHTGVDGIPVLRFFDQTGRRRLHVGGWRRGGSGITMFDATDQWNLNLFVEADDQTPHMMIGGELLAGSMHLSIQEQDHPAMSISKPERGTISLGISDDGPVGMLLRKDDEVRLIYSATTGLSLVEGQGVTPRAYSHLRKDGSPEIVFSDRLGNTMFSFLVDGRGKPSLHFFDAFRPK